MSKRTFSKKSKNSRKTLKNKRVMRGGLDDMLYFMLSCYVVIFIFISMLIHGSEDNRKHKKKPFDGGDSNTFSKKDLEKKLNDYIETYFNGINDIDIYKKETVKIFTEKIKPFLDDDDNINVEQLEQFKKEIVAEINTTLLKLKIT
jgi:hypothetical protein